MKLYNFFLASLFLLAMDVAKAAQRRPAARASCWTMPEGPKQSVVQQMGADFRNYSVPQAQRACENFVQRTESAAIVEGLLILNRRLARIFANDDIVEFKNWLSEWGAVFEKSKTRVPFGYREYIEGVLRHAMRSGALKVEECLQKILQ